jgi:hypothetical protein
MRKFVLTSKLSAAKNFSQGHRSLSRAVPGTMPSSENNVALDDEFAAKTDLNNGLCLVTIIGSSLPSRCESKVCCGSQ